VDFLEAECRAGPVLLVLEDLQWGDQPTVDYVDTALRLLGDRPLMVLATARPEVGEAFPALWAERGTTELRIGQLPRRACEALVREALGDAVSDEQVARLIERSARNAFFLEEIVRAFAEGRGEDVPETVLAMMQSRLESLEPEARRILRAGSLFGESFWRGAVKSLLGLAARAPDFDERLAELERREWITRRFDSKFRGEAEYTFRHGLIREAAYGMLTDEDRALGHRVAAEWLEQAGEMDAMALADHFDRGGEPAKAARWYRAGAQQALEGNDLGAAIQRVERAIACGASGPSLGELCLIRAEAHRWQGSFAEAESWADRAVAAFPEGSPSWFAALREVLASVVAAHARDRVVSIAGTLEASWSGPDAASSAQVAAMTWVSTKLLEVGLSERADAFLRKLDAVEGRFYADPAVYAHITMARAFREGFRADDMSALGRALQTSLHLFEAAGNLRSACLMKVNLTHVYNEVGAYRDNLELLDEIVAASRRLGLVYVETFAKSNLGRALGCLGRLAEAEAAEVEAIVAFGVQREERMEGISRAYLAVIAQQAGDLARAEAEARRAVEMLVQAPTLQPFALAVLASALLAGGRVAEALETARRAAGITDPVEEGEIMIRLVHAEALDASGEHAAAREALAAARDRVIARADKLTDPAWQRSFLEDVPENARTLALAHAWLSAGAGGEPPARQATLVPPGRGD
jgi:tetratricopeptide (TPR) repeat protein